MVLERIRSSQSFPLRGGVRMLLVLVVGVICFFLHSVPALAAPITLSGVLYVDEGVTPASEAKTVTVAVGTSTVSVHSTTTATSTGVWQIIIPDGHSIATATPLIVFVDGDTSFRSALITKASSSVDNISNLNLFKDFITVRHETAVGTSTTIGDLGRYDSANDSDIPFTVSGGALTTATNTALWIMSGMTFTLTGTTTINGTLFNQGTFSTGGNTVVVNGSTDSGLRSPLRYIAGVDANGLLNGTSSVPSATQAVAKKGSILYIGKTGSNSTCSNTPGNAVGCELMVLDVSSSTNPRFVAGRDASGANSGGTGNVSLRSLKVIGDFLYVGKLGSTGTCSNAPGSAVGCEIMVYDISSTTNPLFVAGRDVSGAISGGTGGVNVLAFELKGQTLFVAKALSTATCSQTAGSATGCELLAYDISSSTNPLFVAGRDANGATSGTTGTAMIDMSIIGDHLFVGKYVNGSSCGSGVGNGLGCELMVFDISSTTDPVYITGRSIPGSDSTIDVQAVIAIGNSIYLGKNGSTEPCTNSSSTNSGCEILVFNVSDPTNPTYIAGLDSTITSVGANGVLSFTAENGYLYAGRNGSTATCTGLLGGVEGCELIVLDVSSSTNPRYVGAMDVTGVINGSGSASISLALMSGGCCFPRIRMVAPRLVRRPLGARSDAR